MHHYSQGKATKQAHKGIPEGCYEEEQGLKGFFGPVSHLIKPNPSTNWVEIDGPLKPRMFDLVELVENASFFTPMLYNQQVTVGFKKLKAGSGRDLAYRDADGSLTYFCHKGALDVLTEYGLLSLSKGDYLVVPKCLTHTFLPSEDSELFVIENKNSHYEQPERGMVGKNAFYDMNAIGKPDLEKLHEYMKKESLSIQTIRVKHSEEMTHFKYSTNVYDALGWKGDLFPYTLSMNDMMPMLSHRVHLPPSAHTTLVARDFVICSFLPRPLEEDDDALKVPFYHQNIDYDEVLFYHDGDFFSRDNLHPGMMSFHPAGFPHGPHPKAIKSVEGKKRTNEYAVMVDTRWPLKRTEVLNAIEVQNYWASWKA